jgi:hypothetical protein
MRILFLFIGESHQLFHALPIAAEMAAMGVETEVAVAGPDHLRMIARIVEAYPGFSPKVTVLGQSGPAAWLRRLGLVQHPRVPLLLGALPFLRGFDAIVVPERTTTAIRHLLRKRTSLIFTPHGAGDRAIMLDPRDRHFDFVLVAGEKSEARLLEAQTIRPGHYAVNGYVKLDLMARLRRHAAPLFDNDRLTVLYAPHFRPTLSSWEKWGRAVIAHFAAQDRYNLVVAPHVRLFAEASPQERAVVERLAVPGKILVDLHSDRLFDMSYTGRADIYLGDVSSQVYEFLAQPRPCVFLNAHGVEWVNDPDYLFWTLGDVVEDIGQLSETLERARAHHPRYAKLQGQRLAESIGGDATGAALKGANAILDFLAKDRATGKSAA